MNVMYEDFIQRLNDRVNSLKAQLNLANMKLKEAEQKIIDLTITKNLEPHDGSLTINLSLQEVYQLANAYNMPRELKEKFHQHLNECCKAKG